MIRCVINRLLMAWVFASGAVAAAEHAMTVYGEPAKYAADFQHFDFTNPDAPKGGVLRIGWNLTFDSLNPFISKGRPAFSAAGDSRVKLEWLYDSLTFQSLDEPATEYGLVAERIEKSPERDWVRFYLRPEARFHDGHPITAEDIVFTFNLLKTQGNPIFRLNVADVTGVTAENDRQVRFDLAKTSNRPLPLLLGQMKILPKHWWQSREFDRTSLQPALSSGPYKIVEVEAGRRIVMQRVKDWWAKDLPVSRGLYNFDRVVVDYYRDSTVLLEGFKAGQFDLNLEDSSKNWAVVYQSPALQDGRLIKWDAPDYNVRSKIVAFAFNTRRERFKDRNVRRALSLFFDFEWTNRSIFYGSYQRRPSFFPNSEMAATALPDTRELSILKAAQPYGTLPPQVFTEVFKAPFSDGSGTVRWQKELAYRLLTEAGYQYRDGNMIGPDGQPLVFEFLLNTASFERILLPFKRNLAQLGIDLQIRQVDSSQYINRLRARDYDMVLMSQDQPSSPGIEQMGLWHSSSADNSGGRNFIGLRDPLIDHLVEGLVAADSREQMIAQARALDRTLQWGFYVVPGYMQDTRRVAYWNRFGQPAIAPSYTFTPMSWWQASEQPRPARGAQ